MLLLLLTAREVLRCADSPRHYLIRRPTGLPGLITGGQRPSVCRRRNRR